MSISVLFNGAVLTRPGAATEIDASAFADVNLAGIGTVGLIGKADGGKPRTIQVFQSSKAVQRFYTSGDLVEAAAMVANPSLDQIITTGAQLIVCYKVNNSTQSELIKTPFTFESLDYGVATNDIQMALGNPLGGLDRQATIQTLDLNGSVLQEISPILGTTGKFAIQYLGTAGTCSMTITATQIIFTTGPSSGQIQTGVETFNIANNDTLIVHVDGGGAQTFTFTGAAAHIQAGATGSYDILPGQTLVVSMNGGSSQTFVFQGTPGFLQGTAGTFTSLNTTTLHVVVDGGVAQTITFDGTCVDEASTITFINGHLTGVVATNVGGQILLTSSTFGTGSSIQITGTNAAAGFPSMVTGTGTGDAVNLAAMTNAEVLTKLASVSGYVQGAAGTFAALNGTNLALAVDGGAMQVIVFPPTCVDIASTVTFLNTVLTGATATNVGGQAKITSNTSGTQSMVSIIGTNAAAGFTVLGAGVRGLGSGLNNGVASTATSHTVITSNEVGTASSVQVLSTTTASAFTFSNTIVNGTGDAANLAAMLASELQTKINGLVGGTATVVTDAAGKKHVKIASSTTGSTSSIQIDAGSTTITKFGLDSVLHSGTTSTPGDNLTLNFSDYPTLTLLLRKLNSGATPEFTATSLITNASTFDPSYLDAVVVSDIKASLTTVWARNWDLFNWVNTSSSYIQAVLVKGQVGPIATFPMTPFTGGTLGASANVDWANAYNAMGSLRVNQVVPLCSSDGIENDTYTFLSVATGLVAHCQFYSSTVGRSERQGWLGMAGSITQLIAQANAFNSSDLCMLGEQVQRNSAVTANTTWFPEWSSAAICAGMRGGAPLGEPLTHKFVNVNGVRPTDNSWSPSNNDDVTNLLLNGVMDIALIIGQGFRIERGITTYIRTDNDAYHLETMVQGWKEISYELRTYLESVYVGRPASYPIVSTIPAAVTHVMSAFRAAGAITDSVVNGVTTNAWRDVTYSLEGDHLAVGLTFSPTNEIAFILITETLIPAQISQSANQTTNA